MMDITKSDVSSLEFSEQYWFFQLLVWLEFFAVDMPDIVIETGTHRGAGAYRWSKFVNTIHTVELSDDLYDQCVKTYGHIDSINFHLGRSVEFLETLLPTIKERCIIMLDAHGSGGDTTYDEEVGRFGSPVLDELRAIKEHSTRDDHIIIVDDLDDFGTMNYPTVDQVMSAILDINPEYVIETDIPKRLLLSNGMAIAYLLES